MVRLILDSASDCAAYPELFDELVPLTVHIGGKDYSDGVDLTADRFYELLTAGGEFPKTSQPSPERFFKAFRKAKLAGDSVLCFTISSALSGTYQNAVMTKNLLGYEECYVVDSLNATGGQRMMLEYAARLRDEGKSAREIIAGIADIRDRITLYACIDTLEYLYKGGRISQTVYKLGTLANIKPIITVEKDGGIGIPAKAMGMRKGIDFQCKQAAAKPADPDFPFYVMYTNKPSVARDLAARLEAVGITVPEERIIQVGAAIGSHIGPNACGLVYVAAKE